MVLSPERVRTTESIPLTTPNTRIYRYHGVAIELPQPQREVETYDDVTPKFTTAERALIAPQEPGGQVPTSPYIFGKNTLKRQDFGEFYIVKRIDYCD
jgi:hypothetical protein